jgi:hypothetical protein
MQIEDRVGQAGFQKFVQIAAKTIASNHTPSDYSGIYTVKKRSHSHPLVGLKVARLTEYFVRNVSTVVESDGCFVFLNQQDSIITKLYLQTPFCGTFLENKSFAPPFTYIFQ